MQTTVSLDLGASFTKVSYRLPLESPAGMRYYESSTKVVAVEKVVMIPTVVVHTGDRQSPWLAGREATLIKPKNGRVFENWKSEFYSDSFDTRKVGLISVASHFYRWLANALIDAGVDLHADCCVRVTIPALKQIEKQKDALIECMELNGWPSNIRVVSEPVANLVGTLSCGRNVVTAFGRVSYQPTFGEADGVMASSLNYLYQRIRDYNFSGRGSSNMKVSILDFGSYTLDHASVNLDLKVINHEGFPVENVQAQSWEIGVIKQIDRPCFHELCLHNSVPEDTLSFSFRENAKIELYSGNPFSDVSSNATFGNSRQDKDIIKEAILGYCRKGWEPVADQVADSELVILTGGGVCIPAVREFFTSRLQHAKVVCFDGSKPWQHKNTTSQPEEDSSAKSLFTWQETSDMLGRLATGIGAASVVFNQPDEMPKDKFIPKGIRL